MCGSASRSRSQKPTSDAKEQGDINTRFVDRPSDNSIVAEGAVLNLEVELDVLF